jgi:murein DD-endopeptidase MepM/ murein hydrolase activator NlpD
VAQYLLKIAHERPGRRSGPVARRVIRWGVGSCVLAALAVPGYVTWSDLSTPHDGAPTSFGELGSDYLVRTVSLNRVDPASPIPVSEPEQSGFDTEVVFLSAPPPTALQQAFYQAAANMESARKAQEAAKVWHVPVATYYISSDFAEMRDNGPHIGLDFAGTEGKPVVAARHGLITEAGWHGGYGFRVTIDHGDGHTTRYGHLANDPKVAVGDRVVGGQVIGYMGSTGDSTGPHLHFELHSYGTYIDPMRVIDIPRTRGDIAS